MSSYDELIYAVIPIGDLTSDKQNMIKASVNTDIDSLAKLEGGTKVMIIFTAQNSELFVGYTWLTKQEAQTVIENDV